MNSAINATYVALSVTVLLLSWDNYKSALGQAQQQFQIYQNPTLGVSIQYPSDWELLEESNDKLRFIKQEGFVTADLNVEDIDQPDPSLSEYANTRVNELRTQRPEFQLVSNEPVTISNKPAQKVVYTFEREEDGKTNKVMRIWSINEDKLYTLAYIAESGQYDRYLPTFQKMVDSFRIGESGSGRSTTQVQSSDGSREDNNGSGNCDRVSYPDPDICIPPYPPDLNCPDIPYKNFRVTGADPHGFDRDKDGIGCESADEGGGTPPDNGDGNCDPSYPTVCIKSPPPDLNCGGISHKNFEVTGSDPHGFDRDNDGIGCESANEDTPTLSPDPLPPTDIPIPPTITSEPEPCYGYPGEACPPCPQGIEADWCQDEDELEDFDCDDPGMENDPRCINGQPHPCFVQPYSPGCSLEEIEDIISKIPPRPTPTPTANILQNEESTLFGSPTPTPTPSPTPEPTQESSQIICPDGATVVSTIEECQSIPTPTSSPDPDLTQTPTSPTSPIDPSLLTRSQPQPQCEFGVNPETGLCNTEDIISEPLTPTQEPLPSTPEPTITPDEEFSTEEQPEEEVEEVPEEEPEEKPEVNGESNEDSTSE